MSGKLSDELYNFQSSINVNLKSKNTKPYILTRYTTLAEDLLRAPATVTRTDGTSATQQPSDADLSNDGGAHVDRTGTHSVLELSHNCSSAILSLKVSSPSCW